MKRTTNNELVHIYSIFIPLTSAARTKSLIISSEAKHDEEVEPGAAAMVEPGAVGRS